MSNVEIYLYNKKGERKKKSIIMNINKAGVEIYIYSRSEGDMKEKKNITCRRKKRGACWGVITLSIQTKKSKLFMHIVICRIT